MSKIVSMSSGAIDPITQTKRVFWRPNTATTVAKVGQPVSYNVDAVADHKERTVDPTHIGLTQDTYAEGEQEFTGRLFCVEEVDISNAYAFAGIIKCLGPEAGADGDFIEIFVPNDNGMVVPVWTDKSVALKDKAYLEDGEQTLVNATQAGMGACVGYFLETIDRSSTAGLAWAKIFMPKEDSIYDGTLGVAPSELLWADCPWDEIVRNPGLGIAYFDDFLGQIDVTTGDGWTITQVNSGAIAAVAAEGGAIIFDSAGNNAADDGVQAQLLNCRFLPAAGKTIWFEARVKMNDATDQYFIGLAATDTTLIASGVIDDVSDKCGFFHHAASTDNKISSITARAAADDATADVADNTDGAYMTVGFRITGLTSVEFYVNGALVETGSTAANIPNAAMCLSAVAQIEGTGADAEMTVDWVKIAQLGARA